MALCLVIEDNQRQRAVLVGILCSEGYEIVEASNGAEGRRLCRQHMPELVLLDLGLPDIDGLALIPSLLSASPMSRVVVLTGRGSVPDAVAALRAGARHYLVKPWEQEELLLVVDREITAVNLAETRKRLEYSEIFWGSHPGMLGLRDQLERLALSSLTPVLIEGETGTGKEVVARELHELSHPEGSFVSMNCAAVPGELVESELFGHERGAFTGAEARRRGLVELARDGTLFLDEIGEMGLPLQAKLLRFLQDYSFRRVGGEEELESRCRVVAATHRDLPAMEAEGRFRSDLYYRVAVVRLTVPPLRARREDILPLTYSLLRTVARSVGRGQKQLSPEAERVIVEHPWRGNVRELKNRLERALVLSQDEQIGPHDLDLSPLLPAMVERGLGAADDEASRLRRLLEDEGWNVAKAARRRGVPRHWLRYRMSKYGLHRPGETGK